MRAPSGARLGWAPLLAAALASAFGCGGGPERRAARAPEVCVVRHAEAWKNVEPRPEDASPDELDRLTPAGETRARALRSQHLLCASPEGGCDNRIRVFVGRGV